jgi:bifunctional UDP-N-acetylglucosamine pyrophosphorylase/glucosamine-1-phosphate N-acetyltransferase
MTIAVIILAAGQGTRMLSTKPKVLHKIAGRSLLTKVLFTVNLLDQNLCAVVYGHKGEMVINTITQELQSLSNITNLNNLCWVQQEKQLGTGHAVQTAILQIEAQLIEHNVDQILVLYGDVPLVDINDLNKLISSTKTTELGLLTLNCSHPYGLGRIIRNDIGDIVDIIEEKEATSQQKLISEVNTGIFLLPYPKVKEWLSNLDTNNNQHEYYLTDIVNKSVKDNIKINSITVSDEKSYQGVNTLYQLAQAERHNQFLSALQLLEQGVKVIDPNRIDIRGELQCNKEITIDINCVFEGMVKLGTNCTIEPNCILKNVEVGDNVHIKANSIIEDSVIGNECIIGPFARIRPNTVLSNNAHIGNFVEIKKSNIGSGTKVNHLSYIGDTTIGKQVNIGAGTITCNYDGVNKYNTTIGDNAFIGSNTALIAPIIIGKGAVIGAGSTVSKDAPENKLTIARSKQTTIDSWQRKDKNS